MRAEIFLKNWVEPAQNAFEREWERNLRFEKLFDLIFSSVLQQNRETFLKPSGRRLLRKVKFLNTH